MFLRDLRHLKIAPVQNIPTNQKSKNADIILISILAFAILWSRVNPTGDGEFNAEWLVGWYHHLEL